MNQFMAPSKVAATLTILQVLLVSSEIFSQSIPLSNRHKLEFAATSSTYPPGIELGYSNTGAEVQGWKIDPESGEFGSKPLGVPSEDPFQYKHVVQCGEGGPDDLDCFGSNLICGKKPDGTDGLPVVWLKAPAGIAEPEWTYHSGPTCLYEQRPEDVLPRIAGMIHSEFQRLPISAGSVMGQPSPHTLRGAETNFYASTVEQQFDVTILGQKVHIVATPVGYTWDYGDGTAVGPQHAVGGPLPQERWGEKTRTSHVYTQTGDFTVTLTSHFRGTYSVNGGPPLPIPGQGSFTSVPLKVSVWRSITKHYADDCLENARGEGCFMDASRE